MKILLFALAGILVAFTARAQMGFNSPVGVMPTNDFEVFSKNIFVVQPKYRLATVDPNTTIRSINCSTSPSTLTQLAGILLDPGGTGNYAPNTYYSCSQTISPAFSSTANVVGVEIVFEDLDIKADETVLVTVQPTNYQYRFTGSTIPPRIVSSGGTGAVNIVFSTNNDADVGRGFRIRWRALLQEPAEFYRPTIVGGGPAILLDMFHGSFMAGIYNQVGYQYNNGVGLSNFYNLALGIGNQAVGGYSNAIGYNNLANGEKSTTMGSWVTSDNRQGAFIIGDSFQPTSGIVRTRAPTSDSFSARFRNGYYLYTNSNATLGVYLTSNGTSWATISDSTKKERHLPVDRADLLRKISQLNLGTWNYKGQREVRHYGPMAQEFHTFFGQDALGPIGCDTLINTQDIEGLTLTAVQALIHENEQLKSQNSQLKVRLDQTERETAEQRNRLDALERRVFVRPRPLVRAN